MPTIQKKFDPSATIFIVIKDEKGKEFREKARALPIERTGGVLFITPDQEQEGFYRVTHARTGWAISTPLDDVLELTVRARSFWRLLSKEQRKVWQTSKSAQECIAATPKNAIAVIRRGYT